MSTRFLPGVSRTKWFAGAVVFLAGVAMTTSAMSTNLYGGGSTLPAGGYVGWSWVSSGTRLTPDSSQVPAVTIDSASMFGAWSASTGNAVQYCQADNGKFVLDGDTTTPPGLTAGGACGVFSNALYPMGLQIPSLALGQPDFVASDVPVTQAEYSTFVTNRGTIKGEPIQFPALVGSIAVVYRNTDASVGSKINLTTAQVCGIFAGTITNWNQISGSFASKQVKVIYRSDSNGATFGLMNHLNAVCGPYIPSGTHFFIDPTFLVATSGLPIASSTTVIGAYGDPAIIDVLNASDGAIGYMSTANYLNQSSAVARYATVDNLDPVTDLPATFSLPPTSVAFDKVLGGTGLVAITPNTTANCLSVVNPSAYASPASGYPVVAVSYLLANQKGNSTNLNSLRSFLAFTYTHAGVTKIGAGTGLSFIGNAGITTLKINSCTAP